MSKAQIAAVVDEASPGGETPRSVQIASRGIRTDRDAANFQSALLGDLMTGRVKEKTSNAACNVMGKLLKIQDLSQRYAADPDHAGRQVVLADPDDSDRKAGEIECRRESLRRELAALDAGERPGAAQSPAPARKP
jgi:hypothetical protein